MLVFSSVAGSLRAKGALQRGSVLDLLVLCYCPQKQHVHPILRRRSLRKEVSTGRMEVLRKTMLPARTQTMHVLLRINVSHEGCHRSRDVVLVALRFSN